MALESGMLEKVRRLNLGYEVWTGGLEAADERGDERLLSEGQEPADVRQRHLYRLHVPVQLLCGMGTTMTQSRTPAAGPC